MVWQPSAQVFSAASRRDCLIHICHEPSNGFLTLTSFTTIRSFDRMKDQYVVIQGKFPTKVCRHFLGSLIANDAILNHFVCVHSQNLEGGYGFAKFLPTPDSSGCLQDQPHTTKSGLPIQACHYYLPLLSRPILPHYLVSNEQIGDLFPESIWRVGALPNQTQRKRCFPCCLSQSSKHRKTAQNLGCRWLPPRSDRSLRRKPCIPSNGNG